MLQLNLIKFNSRLSKVRPGCPMIIVRWYRSSIHNFWKLTYIKNLNENRSITEQIIWQSVKVRDRWISTNLKNLMKPVLILFEQWFLVKCRMVQDYFRYSADLALHDLFLFPNLKIHLMAKIWGGGVHWKIYVGIKGASTSGNQRNKYVKCKGTNLEKINVSFIVHFSFGTYNFRRDTFWILEIHISAAKNTRPTFGHKNLGSITGWF